MSFYPGDVVVCISQESPCCGDPNLAGEKVEFQPKLRATYRVAHVGTGQCQKCGSILPSFNAVGYEHPLWTWPQMCFRKVEPATDDVSRLAKVKEPA